MPSNRWQVKTRLSSHSDRMSDWSVRSGVAVSPSRNAGREVSRAAAGRSAGGGVVKFVDHQVVEVLRREALQMHGARQRLHRRAEHVDIGCRGCGRCSSPRDLRGRMRTKVCRRLAEDLLPVRNEQDAARTHVHGIEGGQPGLAQARGEHHEAAPEALGARVGERCTSARSWISVGIGGGSCSLLPGATARGGGTRRCS
jgi:hypothetical protein